MKVEVGGYLLDVDAERTRATYMEIAKGGAFSCGCDGCRNFIEVIPEAFPTEILKFFRQSGIDLTKDAEVYEFGEQEPGIHSYGGEYYFWGKILAEPRQEQHLSKGFQFTIMQPTPLAQSRFKNDEALCLNFSGHFPWVL